jgi:hypothetical protein
MKYISYPFLVLICVLIVTCSTKSTYAPADRLSASEQSAILNSMVRYFAKRPEGANDSNKFEARFDEYYLAKAKEAQILFYSQKDDSYYFLISQIAPSMLGKRHATGGKFKLDDAGHVIAYEEVFRTWKMLPDTLQKRGLVLFDKMVNGESLEPYQTKNSEGIEYIEFPDELNYYDKEARRWKTRIEISKDTIG